MWPVVTLCNYKFWDISKRGGRRHGRGPEREEGNHNVCVDVRTIRVLFLAKSAL